MPDQPTDISVQKRLMFLNTGVNVPKNVFRRTWESNRNYGFVSAGHNLNSGKSIKKLVSGDIVCAYISNNVGFVGVGKIINEAVPVEAFLYNGNTLIDLRDINMHPQNGLFADIGDEEMQEYLVRIEWIRTFPRNQAKSVKGLGFHIYRGVCCELLRGRPNDDEIIDFVEEKFSVQFL